MTIKNTSISRRGVAKGAAVLAVATALGGGVAFAQDGPIKLGALVPLTGAGGPYGPIMAKTMQAVVDEVNEAGGVKGRKLELIVEDTQTNPEAAVRAARKLIEVDGVISISGTWASSVTTAVAPLAWQSGTFLTTTSGADSITQLPHEGYLIRTQPNTTLQGRKFGEFAIEEGAKSVYMVSPQTPFVDSQFENITKAVEAAGGTTELLVYDDKKPSYRSEVDTVMRADPDAIILGGYTPDTTVMLKDLYRAGYDGLKIGFGYSVNEKLLESVPADVVEGAMTISPSPNADSKAYARVGELSGMANPDPYTAQVYDQINLIILSLAASDAEPSGTMLKDTVRTVSQGDGETVDNAIDGIKLLSEGQAVNYDGASGPVDFDEKGDITDSRFRYDQVQDGKIVLLKIF
ncbi:ABC transporter substrate-binding protein [Acuticoccus sp. M5D2P5]|uniref:ABC transporter substrate-binding protein n=1 Tax=Acuticoccus kalidii TaxID=2910977 RepID=UPI001F266EB5|nr:ABC transporter substrate-binding protein [Acuticoccus kalidii]MCF3933139.1 ABC transporter substrate-binding protein [Acuticoccus kalidii]